MLRGHDGDLKSSSIHKNYAQLDFQGGIATKNFPRPRLIKTHLRYSMVPRSKKAKYIFMGLYWFKTFHTKKKTYFNEILIQGVLCGFV